MCIRDRTTDIRKALARKLPWTTGKEQEDLLIKAHAFYTTCLLYTSDAADERSSVDLGGRRIIKKKNDKRDSERRVQSMPSITINVGQWTTVQRRTRGGTTL